MRELVAASLLALSAWACTWTPDVSSLKPKDAASCPGQKACGYRCVDEDDPAAGCRVDTCVACPAGPAHSVRYCDGLQQCALTCGPGWYAPDGDAGHGCVAASITDAAACGAPGHACGAGESCADGLCAVKDVETGGGVAMRGLAVWGPDTYAWTTDPAVAGGMVGRGVLHRVIAGAPATAVTGLGHATWIRRYLGATAEPEASQVIVAGSSWQTSSEEWVGAFLVDVRRDATARWLSGDIGERVVGVGLQGGWWMIAETPATSVGISNSLWWDAVDPEASGGGGVFTFDGALASLGEGGGHLWAGAGDGIRRLEYLGLPGVSLGFDIIGDAGLWFTEMRRAPRPDRVTARAGATPDDPFEVYFADLRDGSIWMGLTTGWGARPWRLVRGDGPRSQMDLAADARGVIWSDLDRGEIWEYAPDTGNPPFLLARGKPWAIALTADRVYWTDVEAQAIRSVAR
jgi:hypothetical protein